MLVTDNEIPGVTNLPLEQLRREDAEAAEQAEHALEWMTGGDDDALPDLAGLQQFLWYDLPVKWMDDRAEKAAVVQALARFFDLAGLPRYTMVCQSRQTTEILDAYEAEFEKGLAAFRNADRTSGLVPPDVPELVWGDTTGVDEALAH
ncbi:MAG: hypothetical protein ACRDYE_03955, partial [Acidimicrobiales bacterium]